MSRPVVVLRPEPGNRETIARLRAAGLTPHAVPLFAAQALGWTPPDPSAFDGLLLTSANAVRHGGPDLARFRHLPVLAVGDATAISARDAGFRVDRTGPGDLAGLLAGLIGFDRLLWLCGRERTAIDHPAIASECPVYAVDSRPLARCDADLLPGAVVMLHSSRAAAHFATQCDRLDVSRAQIRLAAISKRAADAAGPGWHAVAVADTPDDHALIATAHGLSIDP